MSRRSESLEERCAWLRARMQARAEAEAPEQIRHRPVSRERYEVEKRRKEALPAQLRHLRKPEVAELLGLSTQTVTRLFKGIAMEVGEGRKKIWLLSQQKFEAWLAAHCSAA